VAATNVQFRYVWLLMRYSQTRFVHGADGNTERKSGHLAIKRRLVHPLILSTSSTLGFRLVFTTLDEVLDCDLVF
jgi:hypothetical protein